MTPNGQNAQLGGRWAMKQCGSNKALWPGVTGKGDQLAEWPSDLQVQELPP